MMLRRALLAACLAFAAAPALAQTAPPEAAPAAPAETTPAPADTPPPPAPPVGPRVKITTAIGAIVLELEAKKAPITTANFLKYVDRKLFDGASFYRGSQPPGYKADDYGVVQGGLQADPAKVLPPIAHESTLKTGLTNTDGVIAMGRFAPGTAKADWFISVGDQTYLDADPKNPKQPGFAAFGHVVEGMEVVRKILVMPKDPNKGEGVMKGEMLARPVKILTVRRVAP